MNRDYWLVLESIIVQRGGIDGSKINQPYHIVKEDDIDRLVKFVRDDMIRDLNIPGKAFMLPADTEPKKQHFHNVIDEKEVRSIVYFTAGYTEHGCLSDVTDAYMAAKEKGLV